MPSRPGTRDPVMLVHPLRLDEWRPRPEVSFADRVGLPPEVDLLAAGYPLREVIGRLLHRGSHAPGAALIGLCDGSTLSYSAYLQQGPAGRQEREREIAARLRRQGHSGGAFACILPLRGTSSPPDAAHGYSRPLLGTEDGPTGSSSTLVTDGSAGLLTGLVADPTLGDTVAVFESSCMLLSGVYVPDALRMKVVPVAHLAAERSGSAFAEVLYASLT